ncbi:centriolar satellite-associated tubulin polyglutamylase complex regulator 1-like [Corticium candelabrum]|uniref:centriolar satellite-associated tubulin polyglutamylase complex regulator 1-like n=1 Tax=Corticium candelabrum TaxID=121492 RepID=UPI002E266C54|nr:centriolar satellite-associated tubulin polyglutamylase complex regulator 1-like [Corticium candelabrum]
MSESAAQNLERCYVLTYLQDAIAQLLEHRGHNSKVYPMIMGILAYMGCTSKSFLSRKTTCRCFKPICHRGDLLNIREYHSLVTLICPDFPLKTIQETARIILSDDLMDCLVAFRDSMYAVQVQLCMKSFSSAALRYTQVSWLHAAIRAN